MAIPDHFTIQFGKNFEMAPQQTASRLKKSVVIDNTVTGKAATHNLTFPISANETTGQRLGHTNLQDIDSEQRWVTPRKFEQATYDAPFDENLLAPTILPGGKHLDLHNGVYQRAVDEVIVAGGFGVNYKGTNGSTATNVPAANIIPVDFNFTNTPAVAGLIPDKIIRAKRRLIENHSYSADARARGVSLWGAMTPEMEEYLIALANASTNSAAANRLFSADYMGKPTLDEEGHITRFLGVNWIQLNDLPIDEADDEIQYAGIWTSDAIHLDVWSDLKLKVSERDDLNYATQFHSSFMMNAARSSDLRFTKLACKRVG